MSDFIVISGVATIPYLSWLNDLYLKEERTHESLGFLPSQTYVREAPLGRIWIGLLRGQPCGFVYAGSLVAGHDARIFQACIEFDLRKSLYGTRLIRSLMEVAQAAGCRGMSLRCGFDLLANEFWNHMGFYVYAYKDGGLRRGRILNLWRSDFTASLIPFERLVPLRGERDARLWNKYKTLLNLTDTSRPTHGWKSLLCMLEKNTDE
jgi:GNAT superfamily N-acetyltransferase